MGEQLRKPVSHDIQTLIVCICFASGRCRQMSCAPGSEADLKCKVRRSAKLSAAAHVLQVCEVTQTSSKSRFICSTANARPGGTCMFVQKPQDLQARSAQDLLSRLQILPSSIISFTLTTDPTTDRETSMELVDGETLCETLCPTSNIPPADRFRLPTSHVQWQPLAASLLRRALFGCKAAWDERRNPLSSAVFMDNKWTILWCFYHRWIVVIGFLHNIYIYYAIGSPPHIYIYIFYAIIVYIICYPGHPHMFTYVYIYIYTWGRRGKERKLAWQGDGQEKQQAAQQQAPDDDEYEWGWWGWWWGWWWWWWWWWWSWWGWRDGDQDDDSWRFSGAQ